MCIKGEIGTINVIKLEKHYGNNVKYSVGVIGGNIRKGEEKAY